MSTTKQPSSIKIYIIFLIAVLIITAVSTLAQSSQTKTELYPVSTKPSDCEIVEIPENFDYSNLKIEISGNEGAVTHCYVCYSISEKSFLIDLSSFANGNYRVSVINGKNTYSQHITVSK